MPRVCLVVLIGLPGARKTTLALRLLEHLNETRTIHLCFDTLFPIAAADIESGGYKVAREEYTDLVDALLTHLTHVPPPPPPPLPDVDDRLTRLLRRHPDLSRSYSDILHNFTTGKSSKTVPKRNDGVYLLIDDNNYYRSMRYKFYQAARKHQVAFVQILVESEMEDACKRDEGRPKPVGEKLIQQMAERLEKPCELNKWESRSLSVAGGGFDDKDELVRVITFLKEALEHPLRPLTEEDKVQEVVHQSDVHKVDLLLRKLVGATVSTTLEDKANAFQVLNERRKNILKDVKDGIVPHSLSVEEFRQLMGT